MQELTKNDIIKELEAGDGQASAAADNKTRIFNMLRPEINIAWMYPDTLYLHGERGNVMALVRYGQKLGLNPVVHRIDLGTSGFDPMEYDILFYGAGEISSFQAVMDDINGYSRSIAEYLACGKVLIATGTTISLFGERITRFSPDAEYAIEGSISGLGLLPMTSIEREYVYGNDIDVRAEYAGYTMELVGTQIHMADIDIRENSNFKRFGSVIYGRGNNGNDGTEGMVYNNSIFTNMLGPVLVGNPWLAVLILKKAAEVKGISVEFPDPDYDMEIKSLVLKKEFIDAKREDLESE